MRSSRWNVTSLLLQMWSVFFLGEFVDWLPRFFSSASLSFSRLVHPSHFPGFLLPISDMVSHGFLSLPFLRESVDYRGVRMRLMMSTWLAPDLHHHLWWPKPVISTLWDPSDPTHTHLPSFLPHHPLSILIFLLAILVFIYLSLRSPPVFFSLVPRDDPSLWSPRYEIPLIQHIHIRLSSLLRPLSASEEEKGRIRKEHEKQSARVHFPPSDASSSSCFLPFRFLFPFCSSSSFSPSSSSSVYLFSNLCEDASRSA